MIQQTQADRSSDFRNAQSGAGNAAASNYYSPQSGMGSSSDDEITIDLAELFGVLWHWIWLILLVALLLGSAAYAFSKFVIPEEFQSTTKIYVLDKESGSGGQSTYTDLQVGSQLTKDYAELITSRTVIEKVIADNHLESVYDYKAFLKKVEVNTPTDTRIVSITVTDTNPALAQALADDIRVEASDLIIDTMQINAVNTYEEANLPTEKSAPSCSKWALIGALLGALLVGGIVTLQYILDDTIKTSEDIEQYLGLSTLALIPLDENIGGAEKGKKKKNKNNGKRAAMQQSAPLVERPNRSRTMNPAERQNQAPAMDPTEEERRAPAEKKPRKPSKREMKREMSRPNPDFDEEADFGTEEFLGEDKLHDEEDYDYDFHEEVSADENHESDDRIQKGGN
ncbi:non-specific protein-tyrosine kinase [Firmicutes bacterium CAG:791]|nr:non-specific protein-tyrosine kinase [Firmicutes bacterium CAG:791]